MRKKKRLKLKRIVISEHNYLALKKVGYAGNSFNDVISRLLQVYRAYQEKKKQQEELQEQLHQEQQQGERRTMMIWSEEYLFLEYFLNRLMNRIDRD